jgi:hypothetical protein
VHCGGKKFIKVVPLFLPSAMREWGFQLTGSEFEIKKCKTHVLPDIQVEISIYLNKF